MSAAEQGSFDHAAVRGCRSRQRMARRARAREPRRTCGARGVPLEGMGALCEGLRQQGRGTADGPTRLIATFRQVGSSRVFLRDNVRQNEIHFVHGGPPRWFLACVQQHSHTNKQKNTNNQRNAQKRGRARAANQPAEGAPGVGKSLPKDGGAFWRVFRDRFGFLRRLLEAGYRGRAV